MHVLFTRLFYPGFLTDGRSRPWYAAANIASHVCLRIAVYTSIIGAYDSIKRPSHRDNADFVVFGDAYTAAEVDHGDADITWNVNPACELFTDPRRNSRAPKLLSHQYLPDYEYSLWIDGSVRLLASACDLVEVYLGQADMALFRHSVRDCLYEEASVCRDLELDDPDVINAQVYKYRRDGYPLHAGLTENTVILRRHSHQIEAFNNAWWSEYCRHSSRDQVSFNYVARKLGIKYATFPGTLLNNPGIVAYEHHLGEEPPP